MAALTAGEPMTELDELKTRTCPSCGHSQPVQHFRRRTGRRAGPGSRRGLCRDCREIQRLRGEGGDKGKNQTLQGPKKADSPAHMQEYPSQLASGVQAAKELTLLKPLRSGLVRMRGRSDKGRRWQQEVEPELARLLVTEQAAVVVNRHTIRRLYTNKEFRTYILERDDYTCRFCGAYGDTIDHLLPRAKGGHTTPVNCVCACNACNQSKADRDLDDFISEFGLLTEPRE
jgi:hypothetical protein